MLFEILIIGLLLLINAFFALSELAVVSSSKPLLRHCAQQGRTSATVALALAEDMGRFLSTVQVGITLVGILAGAYGGATIAEKLQAPLNALSFISPYGEAIAVTIVVVSITYFSVVIGELVPKQVALSDPETFAMLVARPMLWMSWVFAPVVRVLEGSARLLLVATRIKSGEKGVTETEIRAVIAAGVASGAIEGEEQDVIRRVIRLGDRDVKSIITHRTDVTFLDVNDNLTEVRRKIAESGHSRYPVIDGDTTHVLGIIRTKQLVAAIADSAEFKVRDFLNSVLFLPENTTCLKALNIFRSQNVHIAAVVDEYGSFEGLFTISDLMEAIIGILPANYDRDETPSIVRRDDGSWLVDGLTAIDEVHMSIGIEAIEPDGNYQTIAGFVLARLKSGPAVGAHFEFAGYRFEVVDMDRLRIDKILIQRLPEPPTD